jgi:hypothetical protein
LPTPFISERHERLIEIRPAFAVVTEAVEIKQILALIPDEFH